MDSSPVLPDRSQHLTRRRVLLGSATLIATTITAACSTRRVPVSASGTPVASASTAADVARSNGSKPVYVPEGGARDIVAYSIADNLFWTDIFMEHAQFFVMLMPGRELAEPRAQAERFQAQFAEQFERVRAARVDQSGVKTLNESTLALVKPFIDFKRRMHDAQASGKIHSLVWPLFFDHTAREAERFTRRLAVYNSGAIELERREVIPFWAEIMEEHSEFIAHLLDPQEQTLIMASDKSADLFEKLKKDPDAKVKATAEANAIVAFKTTAAKGIREGKIKSIIDPALADHVRREAVKFKDELART